MLIFKECRDKRCIVLAFKRDINLLPNQITQIKVKVNIPNAYILENKHHSRSKFWQIGNTFFYPDADHELSIPIVTAEKAVKIKAGYPFCHLQTITPTQAFNQLTGTKISNKQKKFLLNSFATYFKFFRR